MQAWVAELACMCSHQSIYMHMWEFSKERHGESNNKEPNLYLYHQEVAHAAQCPERLRQICTGYG